MTLKPSKSMYGHLPHRRRRSRRKNLIRATPPAAKLQIGNPAISKATLNFKIIGSMPLPPAIDRGVSANHYTTGRRTPSAYGHGLCGDRCLLLIGQQCPLAIARPDPPAQSPLPEPQAARAASPGLGLGAPPPCRAASPEALPPVRSCSLRSDAGSASCDNLPAALPAEVQFV